MYRAQGTPPCCYNPNFQHRTLRIALFGKETRSQVDIRGDAVGPGRLTLTPPDLPSPFRCGHRQVALLSLPESVSLAKARCETLRSAD
jgi:hypothetical protein